VKEGVDENGNRYLEKEIISSSADIIRGNERQNAILKPVANLWGNQNKKEEQMRNWLTPESSIMPHLRPSFDIQNDLMNGLLASVGNRRLLWPLLTINGQPDPHISSSRMSQIAYQHADSENGVSGPVVISNYNLNEQGKPPISIFSIKSPVQLDELETNDQLEQNLPIIDDAKQSLQDSVEPPKHQVKSHVVALNADKGNFFFISFLK
jgi:hypothetical protein